ncbi:MAG: tripartite tricarboxylate transporter substrate binding protein [Betaproteobacteria bacterium]|nr:tripartite tricarboxylate transporter substrate binding protein [Betaproteobacteria bacterium]
MTSHLNKIFALVSLIAGLAPAFAQAQTPAAAAAYPNKPVRLIVPFPPGGPIDLMSRTLGQKLGDDWKQPVVIENRSGGNSAIGALAAARAEANGYTLLIAMDSTLVYNPITVSKLSYEAKDFAPISLTTNNTPVLIALADGPKTVRELIARAKANPGKLNYGTGVLPARLAGYLFNSLSGIQSTEITYRGSVEIVQGLLTGSVEYSFDGLPANIAMIREGKLRALAKLAERPLSALPALPRLADEPELAGFGNISIWSGIVAPTGTPPAIIDRIQRSVAAAHATPEIVERLDKVGISVLSSTPAQFQSFIQSEAARWSKVIRESGLKIE